MFALYKKELSAFFSSLIGYLTIIVFLLMTGLMLWVFRTSFNLLDYKYAGLDGLFLLGPFLYLFLICPFTYKDKSDFRMRCLEIFHHIKEHIHILSKTYISAIFYIEL